MEEANTPQALAAKAGSSDAAVAATGKQDAIMLLRQALFLLDRNREYGAAARVSSALDQLDELSPSEDAVLAWLDACDASHPT